MKTCSIELLKCQTNCRQSKNYHLEAIIPQLITVEIAVEIIGLIRTSIWQQVLIITVVVKQKVHNLPEDEHRHQLIIRQRDSSKCFVNTSSVYSFMNYINPLLNTFNFFYKTKAKNRHF